MFDHMYDFGWWGPGFGWLFMLLFWILVILGIVTLLKWLFTSPSGTQPPGRTALDILDERYARGEIDREEYEQKRRDIRGD